MVPHDLSTLKYFSSQNKLGRLIGLAGNFFKRNKNKLNKSSFKILHGPTDTDTKHV